MSIPTGFSSTMSGSSPLSTYRRVEGGVWSKGQRFHDASAVVDSPGPAAPYQLPSLFHEHVQGPVYRQEFQSARGADATANASAAGGAGAGAAAATAGGSMSARTANALPHPSKDRTAWMIGTTKDDLAYYSNIAGHMGPAFYNPSINATIPTSPRTLFPKDRRFGSTPAQCSVGPGPKYNPPVCALDLNARRPPEFSFGGKGVEDRSSFVHGQVKRGYMYAARPATSDLHTNVGPAQYSVRAALTERSAPRPVWSKADRFAPTEKIFISRRHVRSKLGLQSPGPQYYYTGNDIANNLKLSGKPANTPAGKWCP